jgi:hypothetical protein
MTKYGEIKAMSTPKYIQNIVSKLKTRNRELSTLDAFKANAQQQDQQRDAATGNLC